MIDLNPGSSSRQLAITCSSCGLPWDDQHRCSVPPPIDTARYSDTALEQLASHLALVLEGRRKEKES